MSLKNRLQQTRNSANKIRERLKQVRQRTLQQGRQLPQLAKQARQYRQLRKTPTEFQFVMADHINGLRPDHWDQLTAGHSAFLSRTFLQTLATAGPDSISGHYVLIYRDNKPVVAMACQSLDIHASSLPAPSNDNKSLIEVRNKSLNKLKQRILVCGNLLGWGPQGIAFAADEATEPLWQAVAEALYRIRRANKLFGETGLVMVKDLTQQQATAITSLQPFRYQMFETEPNMMLTLDPAWQSFDDYLAAMKSDYRSSIKRHMRDIEQAGLVVESLDTQQLEQHKQAIHQLYLEVHEKQKMRLVSITADWLPSLAQAFGQDFRCSVIRRPSDQQLLGFITTLKDADGAIGYYIGFNKTAAEQGLSLYLRLLYALIADAIALRARWVSLGRTALEPKATLGATPQTMYCLLRHRVPALNLIISALLYGVPEPAQPPSRSPFKLANKKP